MEIILTHFLFSSYIQIRIKYQYFFQFFCSLFHVFLESKFKLKSNQIHFPHSTHRFSKFNDSIESANFFYYFQIFISNKIFCQRLEQKFFSFYAHKNKKKESVLIASKKLQIKRVIILKLGVNIFSNYIELKIISIQ